MLELVPNYRPAVTHVHGDTNYADYLFSAYPQPRLSGYLDISTPLVVVSAGVCPVSRVTCPGGCITSPFPPPVSGWGHCLLSGAGQVAGDGAPAPVLCCTRRTSDDTTQYKYLFIPSIAVQCTTGQGRCCSLTRLGIIVSCPSALTSYSSVLC